MIRKSLLLLSICLVSLSSVISQEMTLEKLKKTIQSKARLVEDVGAMAEYELDSVSIVLVTDVTNNRMRLVAGILEVEKLKEKDYKILMEANFDRALDAKYAISNGILWSVFVHPLKELNEELVINGLYQVRNLVYTYGTTYTSTQFVFGGQEEEKKPKKIIKN